MLTDGRVATGSDRQPRLGSAFHLLWLGQAVSQLGDYLPYIALPLFVKYLIDGTFGLAAVYSLETLPAVVVGLFGGYLIDRMRLRRTMIFTDLVRAGAFGYLAVLAASNPAEGSGRGLASVFVVALVAGTFASFFNGALYSAVPRVVPPERLTDANGRLASTQGLANIVGPALAGVLVASAGFWPTFAINAATFMVSAITLAFVPGIDGRASDGADPEAPLRMLDGMRHLWREPRIRYATIGTAGAHLVLGFFEATLVLIAEDIGAVSDRQKGIVYAVFGAGALAGTLVAPRLVRSMGLGRTFLVGMIGTGALLLGFVNLTFGLAGLSVLFVAFVAFQAINIPFVTIRQVYTPSDRLGRVITASRAVAWSTLPIGALLGSALSDRIGFESIYRVMPVLLVVVGVALLPSVLWRDAVSPPQPVVHERA